MGALSVELLVLVEMCRKIRSGVGRSSCRYWTAWKRRLFHLTEGKIINCLLSNPERTA